MDEKVIAEIHHPADERKLEPRDALAVVFAEKMAAGEDLSESSFKTELLDHFSPAEVVELGMMIGHYISWGRMLVMVGGNKGACEIFVVEE